MHGRKCAWFVVFFVDKMWIVNVVALARCLGKEGDHVKAKAQRKCNWTRTPSRAWSPDQMKWEFMMMRGRKDLPVVPEKEGWKQWMFEAMSKIHFLHAEEEEAAIRETEEKAALDQGRDGELTSSKSDEWVHGRWRAMLVE